MAEHSSIEWTDATWNPITGCSVISAGCKHCYAMKLAGTRMRNHPSRAGLTVASKAGPVWNGLVRRNEAWMVQPLRWARPRRIFVCAHGDLFHEAVPDEWISEVFATMAAASQHTFQVLTKRAKRMHDYVNSAFAAGRDWPLPNVHLGVSAEDQGTYDERVPWLFRTKAARRFVSIEPMLGAIELNRFCACGCKLLVRDAIREAMSSPAALNRDQAAAVMGMTLGVDWVICGGESGRGARPMHPEWVRSLREQCIGFRVPFFFKQWGGESKKATGRLLDGRTWDELPA